MTEFDKWLEENNISPFDTPERGQDIKLSYLAYCVKYLNEELTKLKEKCDE